MDPQVRESDSLNTTTTITATETSTTTDDPHKTAVLAVVQDPLGPENKPELAPQMEFEPSRKRFTDVKRGGIYTPTNAIIDDATAVAQPGAQMNSADQGKVNVLENGLEAVVDQFKTPVFEESIKALKKAIENMSAALKSSTERDLEARAVLIDVTTARVKYEVQIYSTTRDREVSKKTFFVTVEWRTGSMTMEPFGAGLSNRREGIKCGGYYDLEKVIGTMIKDVEGEAFRTVLNYAVPKELK